MQRTWPWRSISSCMVFPVGCRSRSNDASPGLVNQHGIDGRFDTVEFAGDVLPQVVVVAQLLRVDALDNALSTGHQVIEIGVGMNVELPELIEKVGQVADRRITKHLTLAGAVIREAFR